MGCGPALCVVAGASPQVYFERYRTYLLALAPAIAQQLLEVVGK